MFSKDEHFSLEPPAPTRKLRHHLRRGWGCHDSRRGLSAPITNSPPSLRPAYQATTQSPYRLKASPDRTSNVKGGGMSSGRGLRQRQMAEDVLQDGHLYDTSGCRYRIHDQGDCFCTVQLVSCIHYLTTTSFHHYHGTYGCRSKLYRVGARRYERQCRS